MWKECSAGSAKATSQLPVGNQVRRAPIIAIPMPPRSISASRAAARCGPHGTIDIAPGSFVVHPRGELHEYANGPQRTLLFSVRYGEEMSGPTKEWPNNPDWKPRPQDIEYF